MEAAIKETKLNKLVDVEGVLKQLSDLEINQDEIVNEFKRQMNVLKGKYYERYAGSVEKQKELESQLAEFGPAHKVQIDSGAKRSIDLMFGTIGFRESKVIEIFDNDATVKKLKTIKRTDAIIVEEKPNKNVLSGMDDKTLEKIGARRNREDQFYWKTKKEKLA